MKHIKLFEELINEIGDAGMRIRPWRFDGATSDYDSAQEFKDIEAKDNEDGQFSGESWYNFTTKGGTGYEVCIEYQWTADTPLDDGYIMDASVDFYAVNDSGYGDKLMAITNKGEVFEVMATITDIVISWINEWNKLFYIDLFIIEPKVEEYERDMLHAPGFKTATTKRGRLYKAYIQKQIKKLDKKYLFTDRKGRFEIFPKDRK
tara:strand:+ start:469 stop:1083 length:615 start_codon:yes stop_codon:yes gene_type:complete